MIKQTIAALALTTNLSGCNLGNMDPSYFDAATTYMEMENERRARQQRHHNKVVEHFNEQAWQREVRGYLR